MLRQRAERGDENALRALLPHRSSAPALPQCPLADGRLHAHDVRDARARRRAVAAEHIDGAGHTLSQRAGGRFAVVCHARDTNAIEELP